mgnify:CR=1 FL=1
MKTYGLTIDHALCWGCKTCEVACKQENHAADGVKLIAVEENWTEEIKGELEFTFHVNTCRHCDDPPCVDTCPEEAIAKRKDGIVVMEDKLCNGCLLCMDGCPYDAIAFDEKEGVARKCNLCYHRVDQGLLPACADNVCLAHCIFFEKLLV